MKINRTTKKELIKLAVWAICVYIFVNYIVRLYIIPTGSMAPTVNSGDVTVVNALAYMINEPQRGDVIVFEGEDKQLLKRIIGMPNDTISFVNGKVVINGEVLEEEYIPDGIITYSSDTFVVPEGHYFVLGDNRFNSWDSRYFEQPYIERSRIVAKLMYIIPVSEVKDVFSSEYFKQKAAQGTWLSRINVFTMPKNSHRP